MVKDLISVIVPCYNVSRFLPDAFASLENQTYKNVEVIFVNDGSKDDTLQKLERYCQGRQNCKIVNQENHGLSSARNSGIAVAEGEFLYFFDSDDMLAPDILEVLHNNITETAGDLSVCRSRKVKENYNLKRIKPDEKPRKVKLYNAENAVCRCLSMNSNTISTMVWNKLYRHSVVQKMAGYPKVFGEEIFYCEDADFNVRHMQLINKIVFTDRKLYFYRMRKASLTHSSFKEKSLSVFIGADKIIEICKNKFPSAVTYAIGFKCVFCTEILYKMHKSGYTDYALMQSLYAFVKENSNQFRRGKYNPRYRKYFMWTVPVYFKTILKKELKK